jgi:flagellar protein FliO/FliZ
MAFRFAALVPFIALPTATPVLAATGPVPEVGGSLVQLVFSLALVVALIFASLWLLKRLSAPRGRAAGLLRVVAGTAVGGRERVVVLEIGETWLVLGVAPGHVSALAEVPRQAAPVAPNDGSPRDFPGWLRHVLERRHAP